MMDLLKTLRNGQDTNLNKGTIRNADALLLCLAARGGVAKRRELQADLLEWRPGLSYSSLFNGTKASSGYGFVGTSFHQTHNEVYHEGHYRPDGSGVDGHVAKRRTYYYRSGHGIYSITAEGCKRLSELRDAGWPIAVDHK
jgi:hypothetical protein